MNRAGLPFRVQSGMHVALFVEILNEYLYYFGEQNEFVLAKYLQGLIDLIKEHMANMEEGQEKSLIARQYDNTLRHIRRKQQEEPDRYGELSFSVNVPAVGAEN